MGRQTSWILAGVGSAGAAVVMAINGVVWPAAVCSVLAIICAIQIRRTAR